MQITDTPARCSRRGTPGQWVLDPHWLRATGLHLYLSREPQTTVPQGGRGAGIFMLAGARSHQLPCCQAAVLQRLVLERPERFRAIRFIALGAYLLVMVQTAVTNVSADIAVDLNSGRDAACSGPRPPVFLVGSLCTRKVRRPARLRRERMPEVSSGRSSPRGKMGVLTSTTSRRPLTIYPLGGPA